MIFYKKRQFLLMLIFAFVSSATPIQADSVVKQNRSFSERLVGSIKQCITWPYKTFKNNLPSKRFKNAAKKANERFQDELRVRIHEGSEQIDEVVVKLGDTLEKNITQLKDTAQETIAALSLNLDQTIAQHYLQLKETGIIGSALMVKTICLSACATAGALLLYKNLNNFTGKKSIFLVAVGAGMLGGSGAIAEQTLRAKSPTEKSMS
ncbi:MAG: hypothetical protein WD055_01425 [Candidatus Dependentiae bacterium]